MPSKAKNSLTKAAQKGRRAPKTSKAEMATTSADVVEVTDSKDIVEDRPATKIEYVSHSICHTNAEYLTVVGVIIHSVKVSLPLSLMTLTSSKGYSPPWPQCIQCKGWQ